MAGRTRLTAASPSPAAAARAARRAPTLLTCGLVCASVGELLLTSYTASLSAYLFVAGWGLFAIAYGGSSVQAMRDGPRLVWALCCFALLSTLWSADRSFTARAGLEYLGTIGAGVLSAWLLKPRTFITMLTVALLGVAAVSVALGRSQLDPLTGEVTYVGVFESKNVLGFFTAMIILAGSALVIDGRQPSPARLLGLIALPAALPLLVLSRSATSVAALAVALVALSLGLMLSRLNRFGRARVIAAALIILLPVAFLLMIASGEVISRLLGMLGKNATLTGRTLLWGYAAQLIPDHPLLGVGYAAFWRHDSEDAEALWNAFGIASRTGFHFHNAYIEMVIELGYIGGAILVATLIAISAAALRYSWKVGSVPAAFLVALMAYFLPRTMVEVDVTAPFGLGTYLLAIVATYATLQPKETATVAAAPPATFGRTMMRPDALTPPDRRSRRNA
jgi:exopolysaccharide production protein ExoQ